MPAQVQPAPVETPRVRPHSVLFACTLNTVRSPMAEALARHYFGREIYFASAGLKRGEPDGFAMAAMEEIGIDISDARPKSVELFLAQPFHYVITVCGQAEASCPAFHGAVRRRLHFPFDDPAAARGAEEQVLEAFRRVRDQLRAYLAEFARKESANRHFF